MGVVYDILLKNCRIVDGTANRWYRGDIAIKEGRIARIETAIEAHALASIDAEDRFCSPGFIDMHSHSDLYIIAEPQSPSRIMQGITTELLGQDGLSFAPMSQANAQMMVHYLSGLNGCPDLRVSWGSVLQYMSLIDGRAAVNAAYLIPHAAVRVETMGMERRLPRKSELDLMKGLIDEAMDQGAVGLSTGLTYAPCCYSDTSEMIQLCGAVARRGGIYVTHLRNFGHRFFDAIGEAFKIGRETGIPVHISHLQMSRKENWGRSSEVLQMIDNARREGLDVTFDSHPYMAQSTMLNACLPDWFHEGGPEEMIKRLKDSSVRDRMKKEVDYEHLVNIRVGGLAKLKKFEGMTVGQLSEEMGKDPLDAVCDLLLEEDLTASMISFRGNEEDVVAILGHGAGMVGSDGLLIGEKLHPRAYGTFARILGRYVRQKKVIALEEAVRKMASAPAQRLGLKGRGLVKEGFSADIVVFDFDRIEDLATYEAPKRFPQGIDYVMVNGAVAKDKNGLTGRMAGRALFKS